MSDCPSISVIVPSAPFVEVNLPNTPEMSFFAVSSVPGNGSSAAGVSSLNLLTGGLMIYGTGSVTITNDGLNRIFVSGNNAAGGVSQGQLDALSGWSASAVNLGLTGFNLYALVTGLSGYNGTTYSTIANLTQTGVILGSKIDSLSGFAVGMSGYLAAQINALPSLSGYITSGNADLRYYPLLSNPSGYITTGQTGQFANTASLTSTGASLGIQIASTGQQAVAVANANASNLSGNLAQSGATLGAQVTSLSGFTSNISGSLQSQINALPTTSTVANTGSTLYALITGGSGQASTDYALKTSLTSTGVQLGASITSLSGYAASYSNGVGSNLSGNLTQTGVQALAFANGVGTIISGNLTQTGATLLGLISTTTGNLINTGAQLGASITSLSGYSSNYANGIGNTLSGKLTQTGAALSAVSVTGSTVINSVNLTGVGGVTILYSGNQVYISGAVGAGGGITQAQLDSVSGWTAANSAVTGATLIARDLAISGALAAQISSNAAGVGTLNSLSGAVNLVGSGGLSVSSNGQTIIVSGDQTISGYANGIGLNLSGNLTQTGVQILNFANGIGTSLSGKLAQTGATILSLIATDTGNLITTGAQLGASIASLSGFASSYSNGIGSIISGNLTQTGVQSLAFANGIGTIVSGNLTQTGVALGTKIDSTSGWIATASGGLEIRIIATGNSAVTHANGVGSNLSGNLTQTGVQVLSYAVGIGSIISGKLAQTGASILSLIATDTGNLIATGAQLGTSITSLSGYSSAYANGIGLNLSGNLTQTGVILSAKIDSLSGFTINASGALQALIAGGGSVVKVTGSSPIATANFIGIGGTQVFTSGSIIFISGANGDAGITGGGTSLTVTGSSAIASTNFVGIGGTSVFTSGANTFISGGAGISTPTFACFSMSIDGQNQTISTGLKGCFQLGINMTINGWNIVSYTSGNMVIDINRASLDNFPTFSSIIASGNNFPTLSGANKVYSSNVSGWNTTILKDDYLEFVVKGCTGINKININITGIQS